MLIVFFLTLGSDIQFNRSEADTTIRGTGLSGKSNQSSPVPQWISRVESKEASQHKEPKMRWIFASIFCLLILTGCSAVKTKFMRVNECGDLVEANGKCEHGVPVVVKSPTHIMVKICQVDFYKVTGNSFERMKEATVRKVCIDKIDMGKVVMLDPKRPISGQGQFSMTFDAEGNGTLVDASYKAVDETIKNVGELAKAGAALVALDSQTSAPTTQPISNIRVIETSERVIAMRVFPIDSCGTGEIEAFVYHWINCDLSPENQPKACYASNR